MTSPEKFDVAIIGSGPGGYVAAVCCARRGKSVAIIERDRLGGVCLNMGCIPSKSLIRSASLFRSRTALEAMGLAVDCSGFDYKRVFAASRAAADTLSKGVAYLMKKNGITVINGVGVIASGRSVMVDGSREIGAGAIIIATGSRPRELPGFPFDGERVLSSEDALMLRKLPKKIIVLGGGAIGVEMGFIMNSFGVEVHLVEALPRLLPLEDADAAETLRRSFVKRGIAVYPATRAVALTKDAGGVSVTLEDAEGVRTPISADCLLVAVGRTPNTDAIGLDRIGIAPDRGFIPAGDYGETACPGVYAIGDVVATPLLAHVASREGEIAAAHIAGQPGEKRIDPLEIPAAVYCEPEVASFGLTKERAEAGGIACKASTFHFRAAGKAVATGETEGFVRIVHDREGSGILGAHIIGAHATELIHELLLAKRQKLPLTAIASMIHAHPTMGEGIMEAARLGLGEGSQG
jgi:dihydrolipoamide dehydrogenase